MKSDPEKLLEMALEEVLGGEKAPDLSEPILRALEEGHEAQREERDPGAGVIVAARQWSRSRWGSSVAAAFLLGVFFMWLNQPAAVGGPAAWVLQGKIQSGKQSIQEGSSLELAVGQILANEGDEAAVLSLGDLGSLRLGPNSRVKVNSLSQKETEDGEKAYSAANLEVQAGEAEMMPVGSGNTYTEGQLIDLDLISSSRNLNRRLTEENQDLRNRLQELQVKGMEDREGVREKLERKKDKEDGEVDLQSLTAIEILKQLGRDTLTTVEFMKKAPTEFEAPLARRPAEAPGRIPQVYNLDPETFNDVIRDLNGRNDLDGVELRLAEGNYYLEHSITWLSSLNCVITGSGPATVIHSDSRFGEFVNAQGLVLANLGFQSNGSGVGFLHFFGASSVEIRNIWVSGFDGYAGSAAIQSSGPLYLRVKDSRFLGGAGEVPYSGVFLSYWDRVLGYVTNTEFEGLGKVFSQELNQVTGSGLMFQACRANNIFSYGRYGQGTSVLYENNANTAIRRASVGHGYTFTGGQDTTVMYPAGKEPTLPEVIKSLEEKGARIFEAKVLYPPAEYYPDWKTGDASYTEVLGIFPDGQGSKLLKMVYFTDPNATGPAERRRSELNLQDSGLAVVPLPNVSLHQALEIARDAAGELPIGARIQSSPVEFIHEVQFLDTMIRVNAITGVIED